MKYFGKGSEADKDVISTVKGMTKAKAKVQHATAGTTLHCIQNNASNQSALGVLGRVTRRAGTPWVAPMPAWRGFAGGSAAAAVAAAQTAQVAQAPSGIRFLSGTGADQGQDRGAAGGRTRVAAARLPVLRQGPLGLNLVRRVQGRARKVRSLGLESGGVECEWSVRVSRFWDHATRGLYRSTPYLHCSGFGPCRGASWTLAHEPDPTASQKARRWQTRQAA